MNQPIGDTKPAEKILVVDDDPIILRVTTYLLESAGYEVLEAATGDEGLRLVEAERPGLVLLDVMLPGLNGLDVCKQIKNNPATANTFVVLCSNLKITSEHQAEGLETGADGYIARPIPNRELLARVQSFVRLKQAAAALRQSEAHYRTLVEASPDAITLTTLNGVIQMCNQQLAELHGFGTPQELVGRNSLELFPPEEHPRAISGIKELLKTGQLRNQEYILLKKDGSRFPGVITGSVIFDDAGRPAALMSLSRDITARKKTEETLKQQRKFMERAEQLAQLGAWEWDIASDIWTLSEQMQRIHGYHYNSPTSAELMAQIYPPDLAAVQQSYNTLFKSDTATFELEYRIVRQTDHSLRHTAVFGEIERDSSARPIRLHGAVQDITRRKEMEEALAQYGANLKRLVDAGTAELRATNQRLQAEIDERKQTEAALRRAEQRYHELFDDAPAMYVITRNDGNVPVIADVNQFFLDTLGYSRAEVLAQPLAKFYTPNSQVELLAGGYQRALTGTFTAEERDLVTRGGGIIHTLLRARPELTPTGQPYGTRAMFVDITQHKLAEQALRKSETRFLHVVNSISDHIYVTRMAADGLLENIYISPHIETLTGYPHQKFLADWDFWSSTVIHPEDRPLAKGQLKKLRRGQPGESEYRLVRANGQIVWIRDSARVEPDQQGLVIYGLVSNITARKQAEEEIHTLNQTLEQRVIDRTRELSILYDVTALSSEMLDLPIMLHRMLDQVLAAIHGKVGLIHLVRNDSAEYELAGLTGLVPEELPRLEKVLINRGILNQVVQAAKPVLLPALAVQLEPNTFPADLQAYMGAPIKASGQFLGVLSLLGQSQEQFKLEEMALLASIADQIGVAVETARLRKQAEQAAITSERERLSRELHDSVTQSLYSLTLFAAGTLEPASHGDFSTVPHNLQRIGETALQALKEMRLLVYQLRPLDLAQEGLVGALRRRLAAVERRANIDARLVTDDLPNLPPLLEETLYRIAQEALNNVLKHSRASAVTIYLRTQNGGIELEITDNGLGFKLTPPALEGGLGLVTMKERAQALGGDVQTNSKPGQGATVLVKVPHPGDNEE